MQLSSIEFIDAKLLDIAKLLREDDAYYVKDAIISNIQDPDMPELVREMMDNYGYEAGIVEQVNGLIAEIVERLD